MILTETERLTISYMSVADAAFMLQLLNMPSYHKYIGDRNVRSIADAETYIVERPMKSYATHGFGYYVIRLKADDTIPVGIVGILKRDTLKDVDIGFAFLPEHEGKGYGYESAMGLMHWAHEHKGIKTFTGMVLENNPASIRLLEKLGMKFEKKIVMEEEELLLYSMSF